MSDWTQPPGRPQRRKARPQPEAAVGDHPRLSPRQREILKWIATGYSNSEIAIELGLTEETVKTHVRKILQKLDARNRPHAVTRGFRLGLLTTASLDHSSGRSSESLYE